MNTECWIWERTLSLKGYGVFSIGKKQYKAHRAIYEAVRGAIPEGLTLDHLCRQRSCVNPYHLEAVSSVENVMRGVSFGALNKLKTHCKRGHPLSGDNLYTRQSRRSGNMERACRKCTSVVGAELYKKQKLHGK